MPLDVHGWSFRQAHGVSAADRAALSPRVKSTVSAVTFVLSRREA